MQMIKTPLVDGLGPVPVGVTALLLSCDATATSLALAGVGARAVLRDRMDGALDWITQQAAGANLVICDCDSFGGTGQGHDLCRDLMRAGCHLPVMLVSAHCREQVFPSLRGAPFLLRAPLKVVSLRIGLQMALCRVDSATG